MKPICVNCRYFKRSGIRAEDQCGHPQLVTVEVHNEIYGGVTCPEIARARRQCNGLKFEPKLPWIKRILQTWNP